MNIFIFYCCAMICIMSYRYVTGIRGAGHIRNISHFAVICKYDLSNKCFFCFF